MKYILFLGAVVAAFYINKKNTEKKKVFEFQTLQDDYYKELSPLLREKGLESTLYSLNRKYFKEIKRLDIKENRLKEDQLLFLKYLKLKKPNFFLEELNINYCNLKERYKEFLLEEKYLKGKDLLLLEKEYLSHFKDFSSKKGIERYLSEEYYNFAVSTLNNIDIGNYSFFHQKLNGALRYINSHNRYLKLGERDEFAKFYLKEYSLLSSSASSLYKDWEVLKKTVYSLPTKLEEINRNYIKDELKREDKFLSNISGKSLDSQQRLAVVTDEENNLVIAGAGSGKTLTIAGKVSYLVKRKGIDPSDILLITFTKKAMEEMSERVVEKLGIPVNVSTFHSLGLKIIRESMVKTPEVLESSEKILNKYFHEVAFCDSAVVSDLINFFGLYLNESVDIESFKSLGELYSSQRHSSFTPLREIVKKHDVIERSYIESDEYSIEDMLDRDIETVREDEIDNIIFDRKNLGTYKGEKVKSLEELLIANFLFVNGINYEYERNYPFYIPDYGKSYKPDFYLSDYDIYLEHFGIDEQGNPPSYFSDFEKKKYVEGIKWKRDLHCTHNTKLIETYSYYNRDGILIEKLAGILKEAGVKTQPITGSELLKHMEKIRKEYEFIESIKLFKSFLTLFKSNNYPASYLNTLEKNCDKIQNSYSRNREKLFFKIFIPMYNYYQSELKKRNEIDFSDMINLATESINSSSKKYKYIIIDEYQDISKSRYLLVKKLKEFGNSTILAVGDDWQSIYRFAGSDLNLFTSFKEYFGFTEVLKIENTYRNSQELVNIASNFVMENDSQIKKSLKSKSRRDFPLTFLEYQYDKVSALIHALKIIVEKGESKEVMLLGRNNNDINFIRSSDYFSVRDGAAVKVVSHLYPELSITFLTVHKSKGLESDEVIILNNENSLLGFPNKISDDSILNYVLVKNETYAYAEERRLFYVALTRTRKSTYLLLPFFNPSIFAEEILNKYEIKNDNTRSLSYVLDEEEEEKKVRKFYGIEYIVLENSEYVSCPTCKTGKVIVRKNSHTGNDFLSCSNHPKCDFKTNYIEILKTKKPCSKCGSYLVKKKGKYGEFFGCLNYSAGCKYTLNIQSRKKETTPTRKIEVTPTRKIAEFNEDDFPF